MRLLAPVLALTLSGCLALVAPEGPSNIRDLVAARARWNLRGAANYTIRGSTNCFCVYGGQVVDVAVTNGVVTGVTLVATNTAVPSELAAGFRSVEQLFDVIDEAIRKDAQRLEVEYDADRGFPTRLWIDWSDRIADEEYGFNITAVTVR